MADLQTTTCSTNNFHATLISGVSNPISVWMPCNTRRWSISRDGMDILASFDMSLRGNLISDFSNQLPRNNQHSTLETPFKDRFPSLPAHRFLTSPPSQLPFPFSPVEKRKSRNSQSQSQPPHHSRQPQNSHPN